MQLSSQQQQLVSSICRLPDFLANRLGHQLRDSLFPTPYFKTIGYHFRDSLDHVCYQFEGKCVNIDLIFGH